MLTIASLKWFKDGRGVLTAPTAQFVGASHWNKEVKVHNTAPRKRVTNGRSRTTMYNFVAAHCAAFCGLQRCSDHVISIIPDGREHVTFFTDGIVECNNTDTKASLAKYLPR